MIDVFKAMIEIVMLFLLIIYVKNVLKGINWIKIIYVNR